MTDRSHWSSALGLAALAWLGAADTARAAELRWQAPQGRASREQIERQVEELLRKPLSEVEGLAFDVTVSVVDGGRFTVRVQTALDGTPRGERCAVSGLSEPDIKFDGALGDMGEVLMGTLVMGERLTQRFTRD